MGGVVSYFFQASWNCPWHSILVCLPLFFLLLKLNRLYLCMYINVQYEKSISSSEKSLIDKVNRNSLYSLQQFPFLLSHLSRAYKYIQLKSEISFSTEVKLFRDWVLFSAHWMVWENNSMFRKWIFDRTLGISFWLTAIKSFQDSLGYLHYLLKFLW